MAHLLIIDLAGGNDTDVIDAALKRGDQFTFLTSDIEFYKTQPQVFEWIKHSFAVIEVPNFEYEEVAHAVVQAHSTTPFDAVICMLDIRIVCAAKLAQRLGLKYLNPESAALLRNKYKVRERLQTLGIAQHPFRLASTNKELKDAVAAIGLPALVKPADGYGSQNIYVLKEWMDLDPLLTPLEDMLPSKTDYGLGVKANDILLVERFMTGEIIGCDTVTLNGRHQLIGVNQKIFYDSPSFAIKGGCFVPNKGQFAEIEDFAKSLLDAVDFDIGFAHIEMMLTHEGPQLIEINPRLVGAKIGRMISMAVNSSIYEHLIELHLNISPNISTHDCQQVSVSRWLVANASGVLKSLSLPSVSDERIRCHEMFKKSNDLVRPAFENSDRIGYVMTCAATRHEAECVADDFISNCQLAIEASTV